MINLEGSKSIANRAQIIKYICQLQTGKTINLTNLGSCEDIKILKKGLEILALKSQKKTAHKSKVKINLGNAGTAVRFLTTLASSSQATKHKHLHITGSKRMQQRPIEALTDVLTKLGAQIQTNKKGCPPLQITPTPLKGGSFSIPGNISSQYLTSLLLASPLMEKGLKIRVREALVSKPYIEMTIALMKKCGVEVEASQTFRTLKVKPNQKYRQPRAPRNGDLIIEGDASSASYLGEYAVFRSMLDQKPYTVEIANLPINSIQGDIRFLEYLDQMGAKFSFRNKVLKITGQPILKSLGKIDMNAEPDLVMTFAILSAFATPKGEKTRIVNIENLRIKESDRISALQNELRKLGVKVRTGKDWIEITSRGPITPATHKRTPRAKIKTYKDHRIAMAFGVLKKTIMPKISIKNPSVVSKSYPKFWSDLNKLKRS